MESMLNLSEMLDLLHSLDLTRISGHPRGVKSPLLILFILTMNAFCQRNDVAALNSSQAKYRSDGSERAVRKRQFRK